MVKQSKAENRLKQKKSAKGSSQKAATSISKKATGKKVVAKPVKVTKLKKAVRPGKQAAKAKVATIAKPAAKKRSGSVQRAQKMSPVDIAVNALRLELSAAIERSFTICLAAMEQSANLMESRLSSVLGEMKNLVSGARPSFSGGKLKSVVSADGEERTDFEYQKGGTIVSRTYRGDKLRFEIVHNKLGNPISGKMFGSDGRVEKSFSYGNDGQVYKKKAK